jgi:YggT family protein
VLPCVYSASTATSRQPCDFARAGLPVDKLQKGKDEMLSLFQILMLILDIVWFFIIAHVIMSWLINFQVLNLNQQFVAQIWYSLNRLLEPLYGPVRRILPNMQGLDLAPLVVLIAVYALRIILTNNIAMFY